MNNSKRLICLCLCIAILTSTGCSKGNTSEPASSTPSATTAVTSATTTTVALQSTPITVPVESWTGPEYLDPASQARFDVLVSRLATNLVSNGIRIKDMSDEELSNLVEEAESAAEEFGDITIGEDISIPEDTSSAEAGSGEAGTTEAEEPEKELTEAEKLEAEKTKALEGAVPYIVELFAEIDNPNDEKMQTAYTELLTHFAESNVSESELLSYLSQYIVTNVDRGTDNWVPAFDQMVSIMAVNGASKISTIPSGIYYTAMIPDIASSLYDQTIKCNESVSPKVSMGNMLIASSADCSKFREAYDSAKERWGVDNVAGSVTGIYFGTHEFHMPYIYKTEMREVVINDKGKTKEVEVDVTDYYSKEFKLSEDKTRLEATFLCDDIGELTVRNLLSTVTDKLDNNSPHLVAYLRDHMSDAYDEFESLCEKYDKTTYNANPEETGEANSEAEVSAESAPEATQPEEPEGIGGIELAPVETTTSVTETEPVDVVDDDGFTIAFQSTVLNDNNESMIWVDFLSYLKKEMNTAEYMGAWEELCAIVNVEGMSFMQVVNMFSTRDDTSIGFYRIDFDSGLKATLYCDGQSNGGYDWYLQIPIADNSLTIEDLRSVLTDYVILIGGLTGEKYSKSLSTAISGAVNRVNLGEYSIGIDYFTNAGAIITIAKG